MRIAVLGTGSVGRAVAARTAELGHQVTIGTRDVAAIRPGEHAHWAAQHPEVGLATLAEAGTDRRGPAPSAGPLRVRRDHGSNL
ncbi:NAD(P)-binding domain-containing protein [Micromonospora parva]|uniref:NAD(P)-binding domain-containing protein n=1 Tax=Micromonospora parva TaxID=1464048 RepID=UPI0033F1223E